MNDTERLDFLLEFIKIENIRDNIPCPIVCVDCDKMEKVLSWGKEDKQGCCKSLVLTLDANIRGIIDRSFNEWRKK